MDAPNDNRAAVAYLRRSRVDETRTGTVSYEVQEAAVKVMAHRWGYEDVQILVDWGRSGGSERRRPGYLQLRGMIEAGTVQDVYSYDLSRLTRSLEEWVKLASLCRGHGVRIHLSKEGTFDFTTASGEMLANILASVAQAVRRWASERSTETINALRARGDTIGRKPYGGRPGEDLEAVKSAYTDAGSFYGAARLLNERGLPTLKGKAWTPASVSWIIRHQAPELATAHPATGGPHRPVRFALQKLVRCHCGRLLSPYSYVNGRKEYTVYRCSGGRFDPEHSRPYTVAEHVLLDWAKVEAEQYQPPTEAAIAVDVTGMRAALDAERAQATRLALVPGVDLAVVQDRLAEIDKRLDAIADVVEIEDVGEIDWTLPPEDVNAILRAYFRSVQLDEHMRPVRADWRFGPRMRGVA